jgi:hypothetical protein
MTDQLLRNMPAGVAAVPEANALWTALANEVKDDATRVVEITDDRNLDILTTMGAAEVVDLGGGKRQVTLMVETAQAQPEGSSVKEAAAAQAKFAGDQPR